MAAAPPAALSSEVPPAPLGVSGTATTSERARTLGDGCDVPETMRDQALGGTLKSGRGAQIAGALLIDGAIDE